MGTREHSSENMDWRALLVVCSLITFGLVNVVRTFLSESDPLWEVMMVPPILFLTVFGWLAFKTDRSQEGTG